MPDCWKQCHSIVRFGAASPAIVLERLCMLRLTALEQIIRVSSGYDAVDGR